MSRSSGRSGIGRYGVIPLSTYERLSGNTTAIALYGLLAIHANAEGTAWPHQRTLAGLLGVSEPTVRREVKTLEAAGLLEIGARLNDKGRKVGNEYLVIVPTGPITDERSEADPERAPTRATTARPRAPRGREPLVVNNPKEEIPAEAAPTLELAGAPEKPPKPIETLITERVWCRKSPKPATKFIAVAKIARTLLDAGWKAQQIEDAMVAVRTISVAWVEGELNKTHDQPAARRVDTDRESPTGRIKL